MKARRAALAVAVVVAAGALVGLGVRWAGCGRAPPPIVVSVAVAGNGMGPADLERYVTVPLEVALAATPGVSTYASETTVERIVVRLTFEPKTPPFLARQEVIGRLQSVELPQSLQAEVEPTSGGPVLRFVMEGRDGAMDPLTVGTIEQWEVERALRQVVGVVDVDACGALEKQVRVTLDPARMRALGIAANDVLDALEAPSTTLSRPLFRAMPGFHTVEEIAGAEVRARPGHDPVRIADIGSIETASAPLSCVAGRNGERTIVADVYLRPEADTAKTAPLVENALRGVEARFPVRVRPVGFGSDAATTWLDASLRIKSDVPESVVTDAVRRAPGVEEALTRRRGDEVLVLVRTRESARQGASTLAGVLSGLPDVACDGSSTALALVCRRARLVGEDLATLRDLAEQVRTLLRRLPGMGGVVAMNAVTPTMTIEPDRRAVARYGLSTGDVERFVSLAVGKSVGGRLVENERYFEIVVSTGASGIAPSLMVPLPTGEAVPLGSLAQIQNVPEPRLIARDRGRRVVDVFFDAFGAGADKVAETARKRLAAELKLPAGYSLELGP